MRNLKRLSQNLAPWICDLLKINYLKDAAKHGPAGSVVPVLSPV